MVDYQPNPHQEVLDKQYAEDCKSPAYSLGGVDYWWVICDNCGDYSYHQFSDVGDWGKCSTCEIGFKMRLVIPEDCYDG